MTVHLAKVDFTRGELSPVLHARFDVSPYQAGLKTCTNWIPLKEGGLRKRSGTQFIAEVKDSTDAARLIPFVFSTAQAYVLELGDLNFRMYANGGRIESGGSPVDVVTPWADSDLSGLDYTQSADRLYVAHADYQIREISRTSDIAWTLAKHVTEDGPFLTTNTTGTNLAITGGTGNIIPLMTSNTLPSGTASDKDGSANSYLALDRDLTTQWSSVITSGPTWIAYQPASSLTCVGYSITVSQFAIDGAPKNWNFQGWDGAAWVDLDYRTAETGWTDGEVRHYEFSNDTAYSKYRLYLTENSGATSVYIAALTFWQAADEQTPATVTASAVTGINNGDGFKSTDVDRHIRIRGTDGTWRWLVIQTYSSTTVVTATINGPAFLTAPTTTNWKLGAWSDETGWPAHLSFYAERLISARTNQEPQTVWGSKVGDFPDHGISSPLVDDDAISLEILSGQVNEIRWIAEGRDLLLGTTGATRIITAQDGNKPFSATNAKQDRQTTFGSAAVQPVQVGNATIYADYHGLTFREFVYSLESNSYISPELTILCSHLLTSGIKEVAYAQTPDPVIWIVCNDGSLVSLTYERNQKVVAAARQELGGTDVSVESVAVIPGSDRDEVWLIVSRTIDSATKKYVERLNAPFLDDDVEDGIFLDSAATYSGAATGTVTGLDHLEGETVSALADGVVFTGLTVSSGQITLPDSATATKIHVGLPYTSTAVTLRPSQGTRDGAAFGRLNRAVRVIVDVYRSLGLRVGGSARQEAFLQRRAGEAMDEQTPLRTLLKRVPIDHSREDNGEVTIVSDAPLPALVRGINIKYEMEP